LPPLYLFDVNLNDFEIKEANVAKNKSFSELLNNLNLNKSQIQMAIDNARGIFDLRKINHGRPVLTLFNKENGNLEYFIYQHTITDYLFVNFKNDTCLVSLKEKPSIISLQETGGEIKSSLFKTIDDIGAPQDLAVSLSQVFDWTIDFFKLQKGDHFKVIYEETTVDGVPIKSGKILSAVFSHANKDFYAVYFDNGKYKGYFDENGAETKKKYLKAPLNYSRISSNYTLKRFHPITKRNTPHPGIDYAAPTGTPIRALGDGTILEAQFKQYNGNYVKVKHNSTDMTQYLHMSKFGPGIRSGVHVSQGQVIGYVGTTGLSTGPHLCFRFWRNGVQINPNTVMAPPSEPLPASVLPQFKAHTDTLLPRLDGIKLKNKKFLRDLFS
jgi:murein DD-endopeptidase MepM/ murein hydrolase activator NlpD